MKKNLLFMCMLFGAVAMNAQFTVEDDEGNFIEDGDVVAYNSIIFDEASLEFFVTNTSSDEIRSRIEFVSATNADGSQMELCYGECYTGITIGENYPVGFDIVIAPGAQTGLGNHMFNADPGNGTDVLDYVFRFYQVDVAGNEIGTPLSMTYRYDPLLGVNDQNMLDVTIASTVVTSQIIATTFEPLDVTIYDLQGRRVLSQKLDVGQQAIDVSNLRSQMYIVQFENTEGASQTTKIVVR